MPEELMSQSANSTPSGVDFDSTLQNKTQSDAKGQESFRWSRYNKAVYYISRFCLWCVAKILFRIRYEGRENLLLEGPMLLASNHASYIDPPLVGLAVPRYINFMAKQELFRSVLGWWIRSVGGRPVARGKGDVGTFRFAEKAFRAGAVMVLFPEGTRSSDGRLQPMREGVGLIVKKTGVPVVPVGITGSFDAWPRNRKLPKLVQVTVRYGKPIYLSDLTLTGSDREIYKQIVDRIGEEIGNLCQ